MPGHAHRYNYRPGAGVGWRAAMLEFEHQAEHWDTPEHGETGHLIAQGLRAAVGIARAECEHRVEAERNGSHAAERTPLRMHAAAKRSARQHPPERASPRSICWRTTRACPA